MSLFAALSTAGEALQNYQRGISVVQNNVVNASTPGFARRRQSFVPKDFTPESGLMGGSRLGDRESFRTEFIEQGVRRQNTLLGRFAQLSLNLSQIEPLFDISGQTGIPAALNNFFGSLSALSVTPNDAGARQNVIAQAAHVAQAFQGTSNGLRSVESDARQQVSATVGKINVLAAQVRDFNSRVRENAGTADDAGLDARLHSTLEDLSNLVNIQVLRQDDGTVTILLGGQTPLVIGENHYEIEADLSQVAPVIRDVNGNDVSYLASAGRLGALLEVTGAILPGLVADLNRLGQSVSDSVNLTLAAGLDQSNLAGQPLFTYNVPEDAARTFAVTGLTGTQIAAADVSAPGGNGNALNLAALGRTPQVDGETFASFFGRIAGSAGRDLAAAQDGESSHSQLIAQARVIREQQQGVSLDEEATHLVELQRSYQAAARMVTVLDELTRTTIEMLR